jgi:hypothetical protein
MEKQYIYHARNKKHAQQLAERVLTKEGKLTHNVLSLSMQEPTVWKLIIETCPRKSLTLMPDLSFQMK